MIIVVTTFVITLGLTILISFSAPEYSLGFGSLGLAWMLVLLIGFKTPRIIPSLFTGLVLRTVLVLVQTFAFRLPSSTADAVRFENWAWLWAQEGVLGTLSHIKLGSNLYIWFISVLYALFDRSPLMIMGVNVLFGSLVIWNIYRATLLLWGPRVAVRASWIAALFPNFLLFSSIILREMAVTYFFTLGVYQLVRWHKGSTNFRLWLAFVSFGLSASLHEGMFVAIAVLAVIVSLKPIREFLARGVFVSARNLGLLITILGLFVIAVGSGWGVFFAEAYLERADIERLATGQTISTQGRTAYPTSLTINNPVEIIYKGPVRVLYFVASPFPWMIRTLEDVAGFLDAVIYFSLLLIILLKWRNILKDPVMRNLVFVFLGTLIVFSLSVSNVGTALRHRAKLVAIPMIVAPGLAYRSQDIRVRRGFHGRVDMVNTKV